MPPTLHTQTDRGGAPYERRRVSSGYVVGPRLLDWVMEEEVFEGTGFTDSLHRKNYLK